MTSTDTQTFLLHPVGALPAPAGVRLRLGWLPVRDGECQIAARQGEFAIIYRHSPGRSYEERVAPDVGEALLSACGATTVSARLVDMEVGTVRLYEGALWGLALLIVPEGTPSEAVVAPPGWRLGPNVTADPRFQEWTLAKLSEADAHAFVQRVVPGT